MAEYIEREALLKKAVEERRFVFQMEDVINNEVVFQTVYKDLAEFILSVPAADVVPVVHGRWIEKEEPLSWCEDDVDIFWECSVCEARSCGESPYCPNCGAHMKNGE